MTLTADSELDKKIRTRKTLLWFGLISIVMLFAGLTSAYIVRQSEGKWAQFDLPNTFIISTLLILGSSVPMQLAVSAAAAGERRKLTNYLIITLLLGLGFVISQFFAWTALISNGIHLTGNLAQIKTDFTYIPAGNETAAAAGAVGNVSASFLYVITALHILHLAGGILALFVVLSRAAREKYTPSDYTGVSMCALYWHFLDGLWVYLFLFLFFIR